MGTAVSLFVLLSVSVFIVRVASVALRHTGLEEGTARFQALSAISGTGFTTKEAETVVNYPVRRRIVVLLMIIGNLGLVTVMATIVVSFVHTDGDVRAIVEQLVWLIAVLGLLWLFILNKRAERVMCKFIGRVIESTTLLGKRHFLRLVQVGDGYSVCKHPLVEPWLTAERALTVADFASYGLTILAVHTTDGDIVQEFTATDALTVGDVLILYGEDEGHDALEALAETSESDAEYKAHHHAHRM